MTVPPPYSPFGFVVFDRVILDVNSETLVVWIKAWTTRHSPAFHHAIELQPQVVVQTRGIVFLDDVCEAPAPDLVAPRFRRDVEFSFLPVSLERHCLTACRLPAAFGTPDFASPRPSSVATPPATLTQIPRGNFFPGFRVYC